MTLQPTDLHQVAAKAVEELALAYPAQTLQHEHVGDARVIADPHRLAQLLGNLVSNATTYGDPAGVVTVTSGVAGDTAELSVHNNGPAIPSAILSTMFEPMVRGDTPDNARRSVGLGLFIVRAIATALRGAVTVTSSQDAGTRFTFRFPIAMAND